jgi:WD40 repeat protein
MMHEKSLWAVVFSVDGSSVTSCSDDRVVCMWETATRTELVRMRYGRLGVAALSSDGSLLASCIRLSRDLDTLRVWRVATGEELSLRTTTPLEALIFSPDGTRLAGSHAGSGATVRGAMLLDGTSMRNIGHLPQGDWVHGAAFSIDGSLIATANHDKTVRVWEVSTQLEMARLRHDAMVEAVCFSPDGRCLATASVDMSARIWDVATGKEVVGMVHRAIVTAVSFSPDGSRLATVSLDKTARLWDVATGQKLAEMAHGDQVTAVAFSPVGGCLATGSLDKMVRIWSS